MRILIIGFIAFAGWSWLSTYIYVCKIKGLCNQPQTSLVEAIKPLDAVIATPAVAKQVVTPKKLTTYFAFDKSEISSFTEVSKYFDETNDYLSKNPQAKLNVTGYADAVGTDEYNQALGYRRAQTLQKYFVSKGLNANRISIESKGEKEPADDNSTTLGRANNRRTVVTLKK